MVMPVLVMPIAQEGQFIPFHQPDAGKVTATSVKVLCFFTGEIHSHKYSQKIEN